MDAIETAQTASNLQMDYMKLLIAQMRYQNPLDPMDNQEMASQLAQYSELEQIESMNSNFAKVLSTTKMYYANSLIGKTVSYYTQDSSGGQSYTKGQVQGVFKDPQADNEIKLVVNNSTISLNDILAITE